MPRDDDGRELSLQIPEEALWRLSLILRDIAESITQNVQKDSEYSDNQEEEVKHGKGL